MKKIIISTAALLILQACTQEKPTAPPAAPPSSVTATPSPLEQYEKLEKDAMEGNYQAQRNLAFWLSGGYNNAPPQNPILACAWRLVILDSGSKQVDLGDVSNKELYCDKRLGTGTDERKAAEAQAAKLKKSIKWK
jgi:hypothetical protein